MTWRAAKSILTLKAELDAFAPHRSKASDGIVGDLRHQAERSDHNPNAAGVVTAFDITHDPDHHVGGHRIAEFLRGRLLAGDKRVKYIIWDRRICSTNPAFPLGQWRPYSGDPHTNHVHLSVSASPSQYDATRPWHLAETLRPPAPRPEPVPPVIHFRPVKHYIRARPFDTLTTIARRRRRRGRKHGITVASLLDLNPRVIKPTRWIAPTTRVRVR